MTSPTTPLAPASGRRGHDASVAPRRMRRRLVEDRHDELSSVRTLLIGLRWGALAVSLATAGALGISGDEAMAAVAFGAVATLRTLWPSRLRPGHRWDRFLLVSEAALATFLVAMTGGLVSPFVFAMAGTGVLLGYGLGLGLAFLVVAGYVAALGASHLALPPVPWERALLGASQVVLVTLVAGYAKRIFSAEEARTSQALSRLQRLNEANELLFELYRVAQTLPVSLDLGDTVQLTAGRLKELFQPDAFAILLPDQPGTWSTVAAEGVRPRVGVALDTLPRSVQDAAANIDAVVCDPLPNEGGMAFTSRAGVYCGLRARSQLVGVIAVERRSAGSFSAKDGNLLEGVAEQAALAIDNARWFQRLRSIGADEERTRIARDLHDRVGQALAYLTFELDRLAERAQGNELHDELDQLRTDARQAVAEVRETLYDLRTDVTEHVGLVEVLSGYLERVAARSTTEVTFRHEGDERLPLPQEREMLRIAQEAITNVERHAGASTMSVTWRVTPSHAELEVADDGRGFSIGRAGRIDSYGLVGMRERSDAIGAVLEVESAPDRGTRIRCRLSRPEQDVA